MTNILLYPGYFVCYGTTRLDDSLSWRFPFGMQAVIGTIFSLGAFFLPHSPRWLKHVGRHEEATAGWTRLGFTTAEAEKEQEVTDRSEEQIQSPKKPWWDIARQLMDKQVRKRTLLACFLMGTQQACGIDGVLYVRRFNLILKYVPTQRRNSMLQYSFLRLVCPLRKHHSLHPA